MPFRSPAALLFALFSGVVAALAMPASPAQAAAFIDKETKVWGDVIRQAGIKPH